MGTHPIFESDFDCLTEHVVRRRRLPAGHGRSVQDVPREWLRLDDSQALRRPGPARTARWHAGQVEEAQVGSRKDDKWQKENLVHSRRRAINELPGRVL